MIETKITQVKEGYSPGIRQRGKEATMLIVMNSHHGAGMFTLPECSGGSDWSLLIDTNTPDDDENRTFKSGTAYTVTPRSVLLLALLPS